MVKVHVTETNVWYECPACKENHRVEHTRWQFNGDSEKPTISPSVHISWPSALGTQICHHFIRDGKIEYCGDCTHAMKGQTVELPEFTNIEYTF